MATKTLRVFAEYTSTGFVPMPTAGNIDYGYTLGSTFPATTPTSFQTDNPDLVVTVTAMTDFYVWIRVNGQAWNPSYTRNVRVYPDSPNINNVVMNMIIATGPAGVSSYTQIVQTSNRLYFNGATTDSVYDSKFAGKTYINELNFGTAPQLSTVATSGAYADLTGKPSLATVATSGLFTDLSSKPSGTAPLSYNSGTNSFNISQATTSTNGYLSSTDWNTFNNKYLLPSGGTTLQYVRGDGTVATFPTTLDSTRLIFTGKNTTGATLTKGTVVYVNGASGNLPLLAKALASQDSTSAQTLGLVQSDILNNQSGVVVLIGSITDIDTSLIIEGSQLYLSGTVAGGYTTTKYLAPTHLVYVGIVTRSHPTQGVIEVKIQNGYELDEIHDVQIISPANKDVLYHDSATSLWKHAGISTILGYTPYNGTNASIKALFSASAPLSYSDGVFSISQATTSSNGYLSSTDWNTFNNKGTGSVTSVAMTVPTGLSISGTPITTSGTLALSLTAGYVIPTTSSASNWDSAYTNRITSLTTTGSSGSATLSSNVLNIPTYTLSGLGGQVALNGTGFVKATGTTISYDNTSYLPLTGGVVSGSIGFSDSGKRGIYGSMGVNDNWFIGAVAFTTDNGFVEIATGDDGNEPIYVRQYNGDPYTTGTVARTATILDGSGNTTFPNTLTATTLVKSGGTSSQYLMADGSVSTITNNITGTGTINELAYFNTSSSIASLGVATYPSLTELAYVKGVTSSIQTQLNAKASTLSGTTNYVAKFTSSSAIGNSAITDDGTTVTLVSRALSGTSGSFSSTISSIRNDAGNFSLILSNTFINQGNLINFVHNTAGSTTNGYIGHGGDNTGNFVIINNSISALTMARATGAATFSSSVTALKYIANSQATYASLTYEETFKYASSPAGIWFGNSFNSNNNVGLQLRVSNDGTSVQALTITPTGNVGIGLTSILAKLHIENTSSADPTSLSSVPTTNIFGMSTSPGGMLAAGIGTTGGTHIWLQGRNVGGAGVSYPIVLQPLGGNVGIGTSSPANKLVINNGASTNYVQIIGQSRNMYLGQDSTGAIIYSDGAVPMYFLTNAVERMRITSGGNILLGTTTDNGERLYVSGAIRATGNITANSDLTLKKNLEIITNPIDKLMQLNGYAYQWKANDEYQYGVIAQEVEKVLPYAVQTGNDKIKGVAYNQLTPLLIEGFKSHESEITILKARVKYLESKLA
jgi:hypothetical protein